ncbi:hypothetical protein [Sulfurisphaera ohwakuensis]|uniref:hypothetical protein n=1 Tax=Sulfurisphaera ohwakuensis TaxID=69656 RepID=UPI0036F34E54
MKIELTLIPVTPFTLTPSDICSLFKKGENNINMPFYVSSIKGMLRAASIFGFRSRFGDGYSCEDTFNKTCPELTEKERNVLKTFPCPICKTYGMLGLKGCSLFITNLNEVVEGKELINYRFLFRGPYYISVSQKPLDIVIICDDKFKCSPLVILLGLHYIDKGIIRLGKFKSRGFGIFKVKMKNGELQKLLNNIDILENELKKCLGV